MKAVEWSIARRLDDRTGPAESPWTMNLETADGKTVLQAMVHRKARFKIVCERLDLQTPRGTLLAVGQVQISGEGFQASCERLSIPLNDDRLVLEGNAEVNVRTQPMALIQEPKDGKPPIVESRRPDEKPGSAVPILHLKGDHLDLRWVDIVPSSFSTRADDAQPLPARATTGPVVKVGYNSTSEEKWSAWGVLLALPASPDDKNGPKQYVIQTREGQILAFVRAPANLSLTEYIGKRVSVFGMPTRESGRTAPTFTASHVAWE
jgi:hypothetical protein